MTKRIARLEITDGDLVHLPTATLSEMLHAAVYANNCPEAARINAILRSRYQPHAPLKHGSPWNLTIDPDDYMGVDRCIDD